MSKRNKLRRKLRNNPRGVKFSELASLLTRFGFSLVRVSGSHHVYQYRQKDTEGIFVVPVHGNQVKAQYVKDAIDLLDRLFPEADDVEGSEESEIDDE